MSATTTVFGVRHHGPGCARSLLAALNKLQPDLVLIEGPPDAAEVLPLAARADMRPPVALLVYPPDEPAAAVFYPFAEFSPEWQAIRFALAAKRTVRLMDLPQSVRLGLARDARESQSPPLTEVDDESDEDKATRGDSPAEAPPGDDPDGPLLEPAYDPLGALAAAAGYADRELWWEHQVEMRRDVVGLFEGILEAMTALRAHSPPRHDAEENERREASMRQAIRAGIKEGFKQIAVVCGAWHAPALVELPPASQDEAILKGLPKVKVAATWIPWTNSRLAWTSGYGAGIASPGWYEALWTSHDRAPARWSASAARLLRDEDLDASSASVIETVRLAESLAALRDYPRPGLGELREAIQSVLCRGDAARLRLIRNKLEIGERLGEAPAEAPAPPLQRDLETEQKRLRLKQAADAKTLDLDLRGELDRERSRLFYRLNIIDVPWGERQHVGGKSGTFHEIWKIAWQAEFAVALITAGSWGNTVESAAAARLIDNGQKATHLPELTELLDQGILAGLGGAVEELLALLQSRAAVAADAVQLMQSLSPLVRVARYGDVRQTPAERLLPIINGLFERVVIGLPGACASLDDEAAAAMVEAIAQVQAALDLLDNAERRGEWIAALRMLLDRDAVHGLVRGWCCRLLLEQKEMPEQELHRRARLALATANPPEQAGAWVEGVLRGSGMVLLHQDGLWLALDRWISELAGEQFQAMLPVVRRAFAGFQPPERRIMGEKVRKLAVGAAARAEDATPIAAGFDVDRGRLVLPVLAHVLGVPFDANA